MLTTLDRSNYLKGLLVLARRDNNLYESEKNFIRDVAGRLGFSRDFYEEVLRSLMINEYLTDNPITFSDSSVAEIFLSDGLQLATANKDMDKSELDWLRQVAEANDVPADKFADMLTNYGNYISTKDHETVQ